MRRISSSSSRAYSSRRAQRLRRKAYRLEAAAHPGEFSRDWLRAITDLCGAYSSYLRVEEQALELRGAALFAAVELEQAVGPVSTGASAK
jgi:hypothetical protein